MREKSIVACYWVFVLIVFGFFARSLFSLTSLSAWQIRAVTPPNPTPDSDKQCKHAKRWLSHTPWSTLGLPPCHAVRRHTHSPEMVGICPRVCGNKRVNVSLWEPEHVSKWLCEWVFVCTCLSAHMRVTSYLLLWCVFPHLYPPGSPTYHQSIDRYITLSVPYSHQGKEVNKACKRRSHVSFLWCTIFHRLKERPHMSYWEAFHEGWWGRNFIHDIFLTNFCNISPSVLQCSCIFSLQPDPFPLRTVFKAFLLASQSMTICPEFIFFVLDR